MLQGLGDRPKAVGPRPQFRMCYLCGQQFGSASIGIHIPQCYQKKVNQWEAGDPATRGNMPKHPDTVNWKGDKGTSVQKLNEEQYREFEDSMVPCLNCGRTFFPDRLVVHQRSCKSKDGRGANGADRAGAAKNKTASSVPRTGRSQSRSSSVKRESTGPPVLPFCYLCGRQFGTKSIGIHVPQCYQKRLAQWEKADPTSRGKAPAHPSTIEISETSVQKQSEAQFKEFVNQLDPCPNCGRRFLADRLVVHLRSCRPGNTAKPVPRGAATTTAASSEDADSHAAAADSARPSTSLQARTRPPNGGLTKSAREQANAGGPVTSKLEQVPTDSLRSSLGAESARLDPRKNRVPANSTIASSGQTCQRCNAVEYDQKAKFCRECGWNLHAQRRGEPCGSCGEDIADGSRFCTTCGIPVDNAAASERGPGGENANVPTVRVVKCPACEAICDADGNFCDNCGAALGTTEPLATGSVKSCDGARDRRRHMYCPTCNETIDHLEALFCEDCGGALEVRGEDDIGTASPHAVASTLPPAEVPEASLVTKKFPMPRKDVRPPGTLSVSSSGRPQVQNRTPRGTFGGDELHAGATDQYTQNSAEDYVDSGREECPSCGRRFAAESFAKHVSVCSRQKRRPVFNATKQRLADCDVPAPGARRTATASVPAGAVPKKNWRAESEAFRCALREARQVDHVLKAGGTAKDLPPPTYSENPDYVTCKHCGRRFAPDVAERHIPRCATTLNRPKPPPKRR